MERAVQGVVGVDNVAKRPVDKMNVLMIVGGFLMAGVIIWYFIRRSRQLVEGVSDSDTDEDHKKQMPVMQPGMQPMMVQPGMQPTMMQPNMQQMQPMMMTPGMQPGMMQQPGMVPMQPHAMQPGTQEYTQSW